MHSSTVTSIVQILSLLRTHSNTIPRLIAPLPPEVSAEQAGRLIRFTRTQLFLPGFLVHISKLRTHSNTTPRLIAPLPPEVSAEQAGRLIRFTRTQLFPQVC